MGGMSSFRTKRIAVVSQKKNVSEFFRLEAESVGCFVRSMAEMPADMSQYDIIIVDMADIEEEIIDSDEKIYKIVHNGQTDIKKRVLSYPVSVKALRGIYQGSIAVSMSAEDERMAHITLPQKGSNTVFINNKGVLLTDGELRVLKCLIEADGQPVSRQSLKKLFYSDEGNVADVYICLLRKKLEVPFGKRIIHTARGKGYFIIAKIN